MCRSLDYGLDKCTITPSRHTDSDPQDYLQNRDSFLPLSIDHQNYPSISPTPSPQLEKEEQELPNWNLATLKSESLSQTNCTLIIPSPANCETGPCLKEDT